MWIWLTHAGDPQADGREGFSHCISNHRFVFASFLSAARGTDEHAAAAEFWVTQVFSEGAGDALLMAELCPVSEHGGLGVLVLGGVGLAGELESRFKISLESKPGGGCTSCQGLCCGHCDKKWERNSESVRCCRREASLAIALASPGMCWAT